MIKVRVIPVYEIIALNVINTGTTMLRSEVQRFALNASVGEENDFLSWLEDIGLQLLSDRTGEVRAGDFPLFTDTTDVSRYRLAQETITRGF